MSLAVHRLDRRRDSLVLEPEPLGSGGQGIVKRVLGPERLVYKEYMPQVGPVDGGELAEMVEFGQSLTGTDRQSLLARCAWPVARIVAGTRVTGFLMPEVPREFSAIIGRSSRLVELQYLLYEPGWAWRNLYQPGIQERLQIALQATRLVELLHGHGIVLGDISYRNLLWQPADPYGIFVLDCDGFRRQGREPVLRQAHTPDWNDPCQPSTGPDLDTDRYKLALLVGRVLSRDAHVRPGASLKLLPGLDPHVADQITQLFDLAASAHGHRPIAGEWGRALVGRRWIRVNPKTVRTPTVAPGSAVMFNPDTPRESSPVGRRKAVSPASSPPARAEPRRPPSVTVGQGAAATSKPTGQVQVPPISYPPPKVPPPLPNGARIGTPVKRQQPPAPTVVRLGERVIISEAYTEQREVVPFSIEDDKVAALINALDARGGRLSVIEMAKVIGEQVEKTRLLLPAVKRLLNIDETILTLTDRDQTVDLNLRLLKEQFIDEESGS
ncbi:hypothetical protein [Sphaerisporangium dianthi]|uniref:Alkaline phosphatase-like protein PglZ C-terminal domain-containing protein n=1 Tax=Sphaerisporangium dianthi TaxID=1436120 RepID=A0ABV9CA24_9ACTN